MDKCRHHPDRDACVACQKMEVAYCQECLDAVQGLHRPLPLLQIPPKLRHLGALPQRGPEAVQGSG